MKLSQRAMEIQASPIRKLMPHAEAAKKRWFESLSFEHRTTRYSYPQVMIDAYHSFSDKVLAYGPSQGLDIYRQGLS